MRERKNNSETMGVGGEESGYPVSDANNTLVSVLLPEEYIVSR